MKRRFFAAFLSLCLTLTLVPATAWASELGNTEDPPEMSTTEPAEATEPSDSEPEPKLEAEVEEPEEQGIATLADSLTYGQLRYTVENGEVTITDCDSSATTVTIPSQIDGFPVISIGDHAFSNCYELTSITIPSSVISIGDYAFFNCFLTSINIPSSVASIGARAFAACYKLTSITIPSTSVGNYAFSECTNLISVTILNSVESIGAGAFYGCSSLETISVDANNPAYSFDEQGLLLNKDRTTLVCCLGTKTNINIPDSVTSIEGHAFRECRNLTKVSIPNSVTSIGECAFSSCENLTSITLPNFITRIEEFTFQACSSLTSISIPKSVTYIGDRAFVSCKNLTSVSIPDSVISIGIVAFGYCDNLTSVFIPRSVTSIAASAFGSCKKLLNITVDTNNTHYSSDDQGVLFDKNKTTLVCCPGGKTFVTIPNSITEIGQRAFEDCSGLTSITIPSSIISIGDYAFDGCSGLTSVSIPDSVTSIRDYTFFSCSGLTSISIPDSVTSIGNYVFHGCDGLTDVYYSGTQEKWNAIKIDSDNESLTNATIHFNSTGPDTPGDTTYTVTFHANGGTGTPSPQRKEENVPLTLSSLKPSKAFVLRYNATGGSVSPASKNVSCTFRNWNTERNGSGTAYASGGSYTSNADVTFYAQWTNPAAGVLATPSRSGYDFVGWFTSATGGEQITETSTVTENLTVYAHWTEPTEPDDDIYNLGDETYSFENYGDSDSPYGHCFGMSITSAGYYNNLLDIGRIGGNANTPLYSFSKTQAVKQPICYYQNIQGSYSAHAIVAGGSSYLKRGDIVSDWQEVVNYVSNHHYDGTGVLQIGFRKNGEGGHAINFLRYENVDGQDRIYAYDNNFPNQETYFYRDSSGRVWQAPVQTFSGAIDCIAFRDCRTYFNSVGDFDATHVLYMAKDAATVRGYTYSYMESTFSDEEYVMYEIPANQDRVIIIPNRDNADFIYMDTEYSFGEITDETYSELRFASIKEGAVNTNASFQIFEGNSATPTVAFDKTTLTLTEGGSETLTVTVMPDNIPNENVTWTSSDPSVATVTDGKVTALKTGTAIITGTMKDGGNKATCTVTVLGGASLSITPAGTTLHYEIENFDIDKMLLLIADYDELGKMLRVQQVNPLKQVGDISIEEAGIHRAFLLDRATYTPLCAAWKSD